MLKKEKTDKLTLDDLLQLDDNEKGNQLFMIAYYNALDN